MRAPNQSRLKTYLQIVTRKVGGLEALAETAKPATEQVSEGGLEMMARSSLLTDGVKALARDEPLTSQQYLGLEAIINEQLRPAADIINGSFELTDPNWAYLSNDASIKARIEAAIPSIGRIELPGNTQLPYGGTGFVVGDGLLMTNRHVAQIFTEGIGDKQLVFRPHAKAGINFKRELDQPEDATLRIKHIRMIHPYWDMALLSVEGLPSGRQPLSLSLNDARDMIGEQICVVGYPAFDVRNPSNVQNKLFSGRYGVKRLQPGELHDAINVASFGKTVQALGHDCSTLGGNSGSAIIHLATGEILGLHFGGAYHQMNYGVPSAALASDARVIDAGVRFAGTPARGNCSWAGWWAGIDTQPPADENRITADAPPILADAVVDDLSDNAAGTVCIDIPLRITVSIGAIKQAAQATARPPAPASTEAMVEPWHDANYKPRKGYSAAFLGDDVAMSVPLPNAKKPEILAITKSGENILHYQNFSIAMHAKRRLALFAASNVTKEAALRKPDPLQNYTRGGLSGLQKSDQERWFIDPRLDDQYQLPDVFFNKDRKAFDKGHIVRRDDVAWGASFAALKRANGDSYHVTNCSPQVAGFNRSALGESNWGDLENHVLASAASERLCVFAGPVLSSHDEVFVGVGDDGVQLRAKIPSRFWKVIVADAGGALASYGFVLEQDLSTVQWEEFVVPDQFTSTLRRIGEIEEMTGVVFADVIREADQFDAAAGSETVFQAMRSDTAGQ